MRRDILGDEGSAAAIDADLVEQRVRLVRGDFDRYVGKYALPRLHRFAAFAGQRLSDGFAEEVRVGSVLVKVYSPLVGAFPSLITKKL